jgi:hypothetical protein
MNASRTPSFNPNIRNDLQDIDNKKLKSFVERAVLTVFCREAAAQKKCKLLVRENAALKREE